MPTIIWYTLIGLFIFVMIFVITRSEVCLRTLIVAVMLHDVLLFVAEPQHLSG